MVRAYCIVNTDAWDILGQSVATLKAVQKTIIGLSFGSLYSSIGPISRDVCMHVTIFINRVEVLIPLYDLQPSNGDALLSICTSRGHSQ